MPTNAPIAPLRPIQATVNATIASAIVERILKAGIPGSPAGCRRAELEIRLHLDAASARVRT
jgi:hypothetical protein